MQGLYIEGYPVQWKNVGNALFVHNPLDHLFHLVGYYEDMTGMGMGDFMRLVQARARSGPTELYIQREKEQKELETRLTEAREKGEKYGTWLLAIAPQLPKDMLMEIALELANIAGFPDLKSGGQFVTSFVAQYDLYHMANDHKRILTKEHEHDKGQ